MTTPLTSRLAIALGASLIGSTLVSCLADRNPDDAGSDIGKVIGGVAIDSSLMPTVVAIKVSDIPDDEFATAAYCTGVLISQRHVLTNAHCFLPVNNADSHAKVIARTRVFFDTENNREAPDVEVAAGDVTMHDEFALPASNQIGHADLAIVTLATPVPDRTASPISFAAADAPIGGDYVLAGYGMYNSLGDSGILHQLFDHSISCERTTQSDEVFLCIDRADRTGAASGDSGSAVFVEKDGVLTVVGTHTYTTIGGGANPQYGLAQRASNAYYQEFIETLGDEVACATNSICNEACGASDADCKAEEPGDGEPTEVPCTWCEPAAENSDASTGGCQASKGSPAPAWTVVLLAAYWARRRRLLGDAR
ncbi:MAG: trypsin-like serine protease [Myxococcales bacterium]|nr:trypsin-like serine protease [Myxococcales bacterium]